MGRTSLALVLLFSFGALFSACGGDDDNTGPFGSNAGDDSSNNSTGSSGNSGGNHSVNIPAHLADSALDGGSVKVKVSGDVNDQLDKGGGSGIITSGFANILWGDATSSVILTFGDAQTAGAISLMTSKVSTGGAFGKDCTVTIHQTDSDVTGEFSCDHVGGLKPASTTTYSNVKIDGNFTIARTK